MTLPGDQDERENRHQALGPIPSILTGLAVGAAAGALRAAGVRLPGIVAAPAVGLAAMAAADLPLAALKVSDPRTWTGRDRAVDALPHLLFGVVVHSTLAAADRAGAGRPVDTSVTTNVLRRPRA